MLYTSVTACRYSRADQRAIDCLVTVEGEAGPLHYTASPDDISAPWSMEIYTRAVAGEFGAVAEYTPPTPTVAQVDAERDRRFGLGAPIDLGDGRTFVADIDNTSKINIMGLMMAGTAADFRDRDNITHALSAADVSSLAAQAMARVSAIYAASWALKALDPTPADYADDEHWPV